MNAADVVFHVVHSTEHSFATFPFARNTWGVLRFVTVAILFTREARLCGLGAALQVAEECKKESNTFQNLLIPFWTNGQVHIWNDGRPDQAELDA